MDTCCHMHSDEGDQQGVHCWAEGSVQLACVAGYAAPADTMPVILMLQWKALDEINAGVCDGMTVSLLGWSGSVAQMWPSKAEGSSRQSCIDDTAALGTTATDRPATQCSSFGVVYYKSSMATGRPQDQE
jgi:hypothetical protein